VTASFNKRWQEISDHWVAFVRLFSAAAGRWNSLIFYCGLNYRVVQWARRFKAQLDWPKTRNHMRKPVGSTLARSMMLGLALVPVWPVFAAQATTCGERIAKLQIELRQADADRRILSARESTAATMHRQPTPESIARAEMQVREHLASRLEAARKLNSEGKESKCLEALGRFADDDGGGASR
jgi:hypothetical protein